MNQGQFSEPGHPPADQPAASASAQKLLRDYLQESAASLLSTIRSYVLRMGLAVGSEVQDIAQEIFQESVVEALTSAERFDHQASPRAWILGIAVNVIKRRKVVLARQFKRETHLGDLTQRYPDVPDEQAVLDKIMPPVTSGPEQIVETHEQAAELLALVSRQDQYILRLAVLEGHQHTSLARELGTTPGTARVRLHRALGRLRVAWKTQQEQRQKGAHNV